MMPLVSVVVPTHSRPDTLAEALASVSAQTFTDYEIIVVSNGESLEMRRRSEAIAGLAKARWYALPDGNVSAARNFGVTEAGGNWIAFLDDDDIWLPHKLERQVAAATDSGADLVACDYVEFHADGREVRRAPRLIAGWTYTKALSHQCWWALPSGVLARKVAFDAAGGFDPDMRFCEDNDMWRRVSWRHEIHQVPDVLLRYRQGHDSMVVNRRLYYRYDLRHFAKMHRDTPVDLRGSLPKAIFFVPPRLIGIYTPALLVDALKLFRPRLNWILFRQWLASWRPQTKLRTPGSRDVRS